MGRLRGAIIGAVAAPLGVSAIGAVLGFVYGLAPCHGVPFSASGAAFGAMAFMVLFGIPAALIGGAVGAAYAPGGRRWTIGLVMLIIAALALTFALCRPFLTPVPDQETTTDSIPL